MIVGESKLWFGSCWQLRPSKVLCSSRSHSAQLFAILLSAFVVQMYFAYCIYVLDKKNRILPAIIVPLALTQIGAGMAQAITTAEIEKFSQLGAARTSRSLQSVAAFLCDVMITASLVRRLGRHKGSLKSTNTMLDNLMIIAINRGSLTAICALLNLILFLALPGTFWFFIGLTLSGKLYMNSALATLNSRQHLVKSSQRSQGTSEIPLHNQLRSGSEVDSRRIQVIVTTKNASMTDPMDQKSNFMSGML